MIVHEQNSSSWPHWRLVKLTGVLLVDLEKLVNLVTDFAIGHLDIILGVAIVAHERQEAIVRDIQLGGVLARAPTLPHRELRQDLQAGTRDA